MFDLPWYVWAGIGVLVTGIGWLFWEVQHASEFDEDVYMRNRWKEGK